MATTIQQTIPSERQPDVMSRALARVYTLNWETTLYIVILLLAIFTRFFQLGERVMSHDESLHTKFSYDLYDHGHYDHTPLMHGPILFHVTAFSYFLFGANDFTARIYPAVLGVGMVMFPLLMRRWLGRWGAILASAMILMSPLLMYYNRYIREDTPSIFYTLIMVYCTFMYVDGPETQRGRSRWLYIFSAAMLGSLGSKEVAFIYIAVFGSFLTLYWLARLVQHLRGSPTTSGMHLLSLGILLGGVAALAMYVVLSIVPPATAQTAGAGSLEMNTLILWTLWVALAIAGIVIGTAVWSSFAGGQLWLVGPVALFAALVVRLLTRVNVALEYQAFAVGAILVVLLLPAVFLSLNRQRVSGRIARNIILILSIALIVCLGFIILEERSHLERIDATEHAAPLVPGENGEVAAVTFSWLPIVLTWVIAGVVILAIFVSWQAGWWDTLRRFPEFDILLLMGTLILPWSAGMILFMTGAKPTDYSTEGIWRALAVLIPLAAVAIVAGLVWDWKRWLVCAAIFYLLFAFFFTTMFTNMQGLATGLVGSLGYWLEQQPERRGSQPQYYYLLLIMPFYEFLPVIGSICAMLGGLALFWRRRRADFEARLAEAQPAMDLSAGSETPSASVESSEIDSSEYPDAEEELPDFGDLLHPERAQAEDELAMKAKRGVEEGGSNLLERLPFLLFVSWWAILNLIAYTLAGEKMPWLGTHMTVPLIFLTAWFFGRLFERVDFQMFRERGWLYLLLFPLLFVALFQVAEPFIIGQSPLGGLEQTQLAQTNQWFAVVGVSLLVAFIVYRLAQYTGWQHVRHLLGVAAFLGLALLTFTSAWRAAFINYDLPTEFLVYAHGGPGNKWALEDIEELSLRITGGRDLRFAYDNEMSWPGSWYFRDREWPNARYVGASPTIQSLDNAIVVMAGQANWSIVEPLLEDRYYTREYPRLWWPMQDYFNLDVRRVMNFFDFTPGNTQAVQIRQGVFDIWWARDYSTYGNAVSKDFDLTRWPVLDRMRMYVRKDAVAEIWSLGVGDGTVQNPLDAVEVNQCTANWQPRAAELVIGSPGQGQGQLNHPIGLAVNADGQIYVAEEFNYRVSVFDTNGQFQFSFGQQGSGLTGPFFERPNSVRIGLDGTVYVADTWNYRIQAFTPDGQFLNAWGQPATLGIEAQQSPEDGLWGPRDVAVDREGRVYVADTGNKRIRVYSADGVFIRDLGAGGSNVGQLDEPAGLALHPDGRLFVADTWNRRVSVFSPDGTHQYSFQVRAWFNDLGNRPYLAIDAERSMLYVTDPDAGRVLVYDLEGNCYGSFGQPNREQSLDATQFNVASGIATDRQGRVYVSDSGAGRILRFAPFQPLAGLQPPSGDVALTEEVVAPEETVESEVTEEAASIEEPVETDEPLG